MIGFVEFFNNVKGWGKIVSEDGGEYFVHHTDIVDESFFPKDSVPKFRTLKRGQRVAFKASGTSLKMDRAEDVEIASAQD